MEQLNLSSISLLKLKTATQTEQMHRGLDPNSAGHCPPKTQIIAAAV
jgi:hypothetical protein